MFSYWFRPATKDVADIRYHLLRSSSATQRQIFTAFLGALACIFQSAGGFLPGIGYAVSPLATAPIVFSTLYSIRSGIMAYLLTIVLLLVIQPSELIVFPFTTGLLGLGLGTALSKLKNRLSVILLSSFILCLGIVGLLYGFNFPILGPNVSSSFHIMKLVVIYVFSFFYSWLWVELSIVGMRKLKTMLFHYA